VERGRKEEKIGIYWQLTTYKTASCKSSTRKGDYLKKGQGLVHAFIFLSM
jgi:hypothetical protein